MRRLRWKYPARWTAPNSLVGVTAAAVGVSLAAPHLLPAGVLAGLGAHYLAGAGAYTAVGAHSGAYPIIEGGYSFTSHTSALAVGKIMATGLGLTATQLGTFAAGTTLSVKNAARAVTGNGAAQTGVAVQW